MPFLLSTSLSCIYQSACPSASSFKGGRKRTLRTDQPGARQIGKADTNFHIVIMSIGEIPWHQLAAGSLNNVPNHLVMVCLRRPQLDR
jgi:hypothetical protein